MFRYDEQIKERIKDDLNMEFEDYIVPVLKHAQAYFNHYSLGTKIELVVSNNNAKYFLYL